MQVSAVDGGNGNKGKGKGKVGNKSKNGDGTKGKDRDKERRPVGSSILALTVRSGVKSAQSAEDNWLGRKPV